MTPEEKKLLEERIERADALEKQICQYEQLITILLEARDGPSDNCNQIVLTLAGHNTPYQAYYTDSKSILIKQERSISIEKVCWIRKETNLVQEVVASILDTCNNKLTVLQKDLVAL